MSVSPLGVARRRVHSSMTVINALFSMHLALMIQQRLLWTRLVSYVIFMVFARSTGMWFLQLRIFVGDDSLVSGRV